MPRSSNAGAETNIKIASAIMASNIAKRLVTKSMTERESASKIQSLYRGRLARKRMQQKLFALGSFNSALQNCKERTGLRIVARATGRESEVNELLLRGEFRRCKRILFAGEEVQSPSDIDRGRNSSVSGFRVFGMHLVDLCLESEHFAQGGAGKVYKGNFKDRDIVAKCHLESGDDNKDLLNEVLMLTRLVHPNIIE